MTANASIVARATYQEDLLAPTKGTITSDTVKLFVMGCRASSPKRGSPADSREKTTEPRPENCP